MDIDESGERTRDGCSLTQILLMSPVELPSIVIDIVDQ